MLAMMKRFNASTASILDNDEAIRDISVLTHTSSQNGGFIIAATVTAITKEAELEEWIFLIIGEIVDYGEDIKDDAQRFKLRPVFVLSGTIQEKRFFAPIDCYGLRKNSDDAEVRIIPNTQEDFYALIAYANAAFLDIMIDKQIDTEEYALHTNQDRVPFGFNIYEDIKFRSESDLTNHILDNTDDSNLGSVKPTLQAPIQIFIKKQQG